MAKCTCTTGLSVLYVRGGKKTYKQCRRWFHSNYPDVRVPASWTTCRLLKKFRSIRYFSRKKYSSHNSVIIDGKFEDTKARFEHLTRKSPKWIAPPTYVSIVTARRATAKLPRWAQTTEDSVYERIHMSNGFCRQYISASSTQNLLISFMELGSIWLHNVQNNI
jgi:hypothetical protein